MTFAILPEMGARPKGFDYICLLGRLRTSLEYRKELIGSQDLDSLEDSQVLEVSVTRNDEFRVTGKSTLQDTMISRVCDHLLEPKCRFDEKGEFRQQLQILDDALLWK